MMCSCLMDSEHIRGQPPSRYGNELRNGDGGGEGFPARGWFSTDNICRAFSSFDASEASSSALAALASKT
jgi:hypothetical protein